MHEGRTFNYSFNKPDLPSSRVSTDPPFTFLSVDYAGSLHVCNICEGSRTYRAWVFLMTCETWNMLKVSVILQFYYLH